MKVKIKQLGGMGTREVGGRQWWMEYILIYYIYYIVYRIFQNKIVLCLKILFHVQLKYPGHN